jgi:hypothetical protein
LFIELLRIFTVFLIHIEKPPALLNLRFRWDIKLSV